MNDTHICELNELRPDRSRLYEFLKRHFGPELAHQELGPIVVREETTREYANAFGFSVNTRRFVETGDVADGLMSGAIVVPKDGSPVHWAPTHVPVATYLDVVARGETWWSTGGAEPVTEVKYYALITPGRTRSNPSGIMRRLTANGRTEDEVFTRSLVWKPTDFFRKYDLGHNDDDYVEITPSEAAEFVRKVREEQSG